MKYFWPICIFILFISITHSCTFESEEEYFGEQECDSLKVNRDSLEIYYEDLTYIFSGICQQCHNPDLKPPYREGILMDSYENVVASMRTGLPLAAIKHERHPTNNKTYKMPYNQPKLSDCEIQKIAIWIENDMPEEKN